jgi:hypothetical protein
VGLKHRIHSFDEDVRGAKGFFDRSQEEFAFLFRRFVVELCQLSSVVDDLHHFLGLRMLGVDFGEVDRQVHVPVAQPVGQVADLPEANRDGHFCNTSTEQQKRKQQAYHHVY